MIAIDKSAVATGVALAGLSALVVRAVNMGMDEVQRLINEKRAKDKSK